MKFEDLPGESSADLQLSLHAMQSQAHAGISLDLLQQQRLTGLSVLQQQILIQQQHQLLHAHSLLQGVPPAVPDTLSLSMAPSLALGMGLGMGVSGAVVPSSASPSAATLASASAGASPITPDPLLASTPAVDPTARAKQQQRASAADIWREKKRRLAGNQDASSAKQASADPEAAPPQDAEALARGGSSGAGMPAALGPSASLGAVKATATAPKAAGEGGSGRSKVPADKRKEESRRKRLLRNRVSAQQARERKRSYIQELESQCAELEAKNSNLEVQIDSLSQENDGLRQVMKRKVRAVRVDMEVPATDYGEDEDEEDNY